MGWFAINILLPVFGPLALLFIAGKICTPATPIASRIRILNTIKDGQLSWVAVALSANSSFELFVQWQSNIPPAWAGPILFFNVLNLVLSGLLAVLGALFPVLEPKVELDSMAAWLLHYRLLCVSAFTFAIAAALLCIVHFALELACK
ncbi:hypothetical protein [Pseudoduganella violaceinigra]|uniref:hypothetical protein n=1 Tax=Pseudoduganella violaceinigra TaxID=246602 RepID=UPI00048328AF|nr:hypothetical protein [Pseudoduganella violaceinigra]